MDKTYLYEVSFVENNLSMEWRRTIEILTNFQIQHPNELLGYVRSQERIHFSIDIKIISVMQREVCPVVREWVLKKGQYEMIQL